LLLIKPEFHSGLIHQAMNAQLPEKVGDIT